MRLTTRGKVVVALLALAFVAVIALTPPGWWM